MHHFPKVFIYVSNSHFLHYVSISILANSRELQDRVKSVVILTIIVIVVLEFVLYCDSHLLWLLLLSQA